MFVSTLEKLTLIKPIDDDDDPLVFGDDEIVLFIVAGVVDAAAAAAAAIAAATADDDDAVIWWLGWEWCGFEFICVFSIFYFITNYSESHWMNGQTHTERDRFSNRSTDWCFTRNKKMKNSKENF